MCQMEVFNTISKSSEGIFKDRGSKFLGYAFPFNELLELNERIAEIHKIHPKARHICYAYRLTPDGSVFRANDDGEPSGTAGKPILGQIDSHQLTNTLILVVRYFGGTKLGTGGLINAYRTTAKETILANRIVAKKLLANYVLKFEYTKMAQVMEAVKKSSFVIEKQEFELTPFLQLSIEKKDHEKLAHNLQAAIVGKIPEVFNPETDVRDFELILKKVD